MVGKVYQCIAANGHGRMNKTPDPGGKRMMPGGRTGQLGMLPKAWPSIDLAQLKRWMFKEIHIFGIEDFHIEGERLVQLRHWAVIAIAPLATAQCVLWVHEVPYVEFLSVLAFALNPVFTYCMVENLSSTASRGVRIGLCVGCWAVYPVALLYALNSLSNVGLSVIGPAMYIMFGSSDGAYSDVWETAVGFAYIYTTSWCSIGALAGGLLGYLLAKLVAGVKKLLKR